MSVREKVCIRVREKAFVGGRSKDEREEGTMGTWE